MDDKPMCQNGQFKSTITRICAISTTDLTCRRRIAIGYTKLAAKVKELEEHEVDKELAKKAANSTQIPWDHQMVHKQQAKLKKVAKKDPELGHQKLKAYKLECQEVAQSEG